MMFIADRKLCNFCFFLYSATSNFQFDLLTAEHLNNQLERNKVNNMQLIFGTNHGAFHF